MIRILLCDREPVFLGRLTQALEAALEALGVKARLCPLRDPAQLEEPWDLVFLDPASGFGSCTGLELAARLRRVRPELLILFVSGSNAHAAAGYELQIFRYLLKEELDNRLPAYLRAALDRLAARQQTLTISICGEIMDLPLKNILYLASDGHAALVNLLTGPDLTALRQYRYYASMQQLEEQLAPLGFLRLHRSCLVNMRHIRHLQPDRALLTGGVTVPVSRKNHTLLKKRFLLWKAR